MATIIWKYDHTHSRGDIICLARLGFSSYLSSFVFRPFKAKKKLLKRMASLTFGFGAAVAAAAGGTRAVAAAGGRVPFAAAKEEKGLLDWIVGGLQKEEQFYETDPILKKKGEGEKNGTAGKKSTAVPVPKKKSGGLGGLFAKN